MSFRKDSSFERQHVTVFPFRRDKEGAPEPWVFVPTVFDYARMEWNGNYGNWFTLGRLADRFSMSAATAQLNSIQEQLRQEIPGGGNQKPGSLSASLQPMQEAMVGDSGQGIWLLMAAVGGLLLLACLNLANAQLGRAVSSARDAAVAHWGPRSGDCCGAC